MLAWELGLPLGEHKTRRDAHEALADTDDQSDFDPPVLVPENERAYLSLVRYLPLAERDNSTGAMRLDYGALTGIMRQRKCSRYDYEKCLDAWIEIRAMDAEELLKRSRSQSEWEAQKRAFKNE